MALKKKRKVADKPKRRGSKKRKSSFVYKERDPSAFKARAEQTGSKYDGYLKGDVDRLTLKAGENLFRILPPTWPDHEHCGYEIYVHSFVGTEDGSYLCHEKMLGERCPICEAAREAKADGDEEDAKSMEAKKRVLYYVIDRDDDNPIPKVLDVGWNMDKDIFSLTYNNRTGRVLHVDHPEEGRDITVKRQGTGLKTKYYGHQVDPDPTPIDDDADVQQEIIDMIEERPLPSLLEWHDTKYLEKIMSVGVSRDEDEDEDDEEEESPRRRRSKPSRRRKEEPEEDDEDDEDDEEEEERPKRRGRSKPSRRHRTEPEEDEDDEDDEDDDDVPWDDEDEDVDDEEEDDLDEDDEEDDEEEDERPRRRRAGRTKPADTKKSKSTRVRTTRKRGRR